MHRTATDPQNLNLDNASGGSVDAHHPKPQRAIIFAGGDIHTAPSPEADTVVIAADSGYDHAVALRYPVDLLIGDLDSISDEGLAHAHSHGVRIEQHPAAKDATDLELAIDAAAGRGVTAVDIFGGEAGRIDHLLGAAIGLTDPRWDSLDITWHTDNADIRPLVGGGHMHIDAAVGSLVSLIAVSDSAGITTQGLRWELAGATLHRGTSRGLSNEIVEHLATISIDSGALLVVTDTGHHDQHHADGAVGSPGDNR